MDQVETEQIFLACSNYSVCRAWLLTTKCLSEFNDSHNSRITHYNEELVIPYYKNKSILEVN
jgi:hypothetical protein